MPKNRISELRRIDGMNQRELGEKLGVGQTTISAWERGQNEPDIESLNKMAKLFHASIGYLLGYEGESYKRGLSDGEYEAYEEGRDAARREREAERWEELQRADMTEEEIEKLQLEREYEAWEKAEKPDTIEGYIASRIIDAKPKEQRKYLLDLLERIAQGH